MFNSIGGVSGLGAPIQNQIGGENFIRHIGSDKLIFDFKSGSGTTVKDRSREGNDGTLGAGAKAPTWKINSLYFDGGDYVDLTGITHGITAGAFTFCFDLNNASNYIFDQTGVRVLFAVQNDKIRFYLSATRYITDTGISSISPIMFQATRDISGNLECYINGKASNKGSSDTGDLTYDGVSDVGFGSNSNGTDKFITTTVRSFRILSKCLSGIEAQQIFLSQKWKGNG